MTMDDKLKVKDNDHLLRDPFNNALINTNYQQYNNYLKTKELKQSECRQIKDMQDDISCLKNDLSEIKNLLLNLHK